MPDENTPLLIFAAYFAIAIGTARGVYWLFSTAGENLKEDKRSKISEWLLNKEGSKKLSNLPSAFIDLFDSIFTEKHLSWRCFRRSVVASLISVAVLAIAFWPIVASRGIRLWGFEDPWLLLIALAVVPGNFLADYVSLLETRGILSVMRRGPSVVRILGLLAADAVLTTIIYVTIGWGVAAGILDLIGGDDALSILLNMLDTLLGSGDLFHVDDQTQWPVLILFYSTFFTSAWLWLFAVSTGLVRISKVWVVGRGKIASWFDVEERPLRSLGTVAAMLTVVVFVVAWPFLT